MWFLRNVVGVGRCICSASQVNGIDKNTIAEEGIGFPIGCVIIGVDIVMVVVCRWVRCTVSGELNWRYIRGIFRCVHWSQGTKSGRIVGI